QHSLIAQRVGHALAGRAHLAAASSSDTSAPPGRGCEGKATPQRHAQDSTHKSPHRFVRQFSPRARETLHRPERTPPALASSESLPTPEEKPPASGSHFSPHSPALQQAEPKQEQRAGGSSPRRQSAIARLQATAAPLRQAALDTA